MYVCMYVCVYIYTHTRILIDSYDMPTFQGANPHFSSPLRWDPRSINSSRPIPMAWWVPSRPESDQECGFAEPRELVGHGESFWKSLSYYFLILPVLLPASVVGFVVGLRWLTDAPWQSQRVGSLAMTPGSGWISGGDPVDMRQIFQDEETVWVTRCLLPACFRSQRQTASHFQENFKTNLSFLWVFMGDHCWFPRNVQKQSV